MEKFKRIVQSGALYTTLISCLFYPLAALSGNAGFVMSAKRFFTILLFGFIIALTQALVSSLNLKKIFNYPIYYFVLLLSFFFNTILLSAQKLSTRNRDIFHSFPSVFSFPLHLLPLAKSRIICYAKVSENTIRRDPLC